MGYNDGLIWFREQERLANEKKAAQAAKDAAKKKEDDARNAQPNVSGPYGNQWSKFGVPTDASGRPLTPKWETIGDSTTGLLKDQYNIKDQLNTSGVDAIRAEATRAPGTMSKWGQMAMTQQNDQLANQQAGRLAQAQSGLAMQGGLRGGQRERLQSQNMLAGLQGQQQTGMGIRMQDEQDRQKWMGMMPQLDMQQAQYKTDLQDRNIGRATNEITQGRLAQQGQYNEAMRGWAAERTAAATPSSGGGGCCMIAAISMAALGGHNTAKAQDVILASKADVSEALETYKDDAPATDAINTLVNVRKTRDTMCTKRQLRGYYKFSEATLPFVERSPILIKLGEKIMVEPIAKLGKGEESFLGKLWIKFWGFVGSNSQFTRSNGEVI